MVKAPGSSTVKRTCRFFWPFGPATTRMRSTTCSCAVCGVLKTPVDVFNTPHTAQEHVVERIRVVAGPNGQKNLQVRFTVDDPGAFTMPWTGVETYRAVGGAAGAVDPVGGGDVLQEEVCAENNRVIGIPDVSIPTETSAPRR